MRCPKCSYISFDKVTSCVKCSTDVTEVAHALNGTAFKPLGTFYLGSLLPDYAAAFVQDTQVDDFAMDAGDDLEISVDAAEDFGAVPDLPGDVLPEEDFSFGAEEELADFGGEDISFDDHDLSGVDLTGFEESGTGFSPGSPAPERATAAPAEEVVEDLKLDDVPEFDLSGVDFEEDIELEADSASPAEEMADTPDLSDIDLSLGDDELEMAGEEEEMPDLGDLELEENRKDNGASELPDLEL